MNPDSPSALVRAAKMQTLILIEVCRIARVGQQFTLTVRQKLTSKQATNGMRLINASFVLLTEAGSNPHVKRAIMSAISKLYIEMRYDPSDDIPRR